MDGDGNICYKNTYEREVQPKPCERGENRWGVCVSECPTGTELCGVPELDFGFMCLDTSIDCADYIQENVEYAAGWAAAIGTQNPVAIINMITGDHPDLYGQCAW